MAPRWSLCENKGSKALPVACSRSWRWGVRKLCHQKERQKSSFKFIKKAMQRYGSPNEIVTDKLGSYGAAARELGCSKKQITKRWANNRVENSHLPFRRRERAMLRFRRMHSLQKFASIHASFHNLFNSQRSLSKRRTFKLNRDATRWELRQTLKQVAHIMW